MNRLFLLAILLFSIVACKKVKEEVQERAIMDFITDGRWKITKYSQGGWDGSSHFRVSTFQFRSNETVDAIRNGIVEVRGIWKGNIDSHTIYTNFTTSDPYLLLLNTTWTLIGGDQTFVEAIARSNGDIKTIRLEKV